MILSIYYFFLKIGAMGPHTFLRIKKKSFYDLMMDSLFGTWFGDASWSGATWTLSIELFATFFIYLFTQTSTQYRNRSVLYFMIIGFVFFPEISDSYDMTKYRLPELVKYIPIFFFGVAFADIETHPARPLDKVRELSIWWKIPLNTLLIIIIVSWGSYSGDGQCLRLDDGNCMYWQYATFGERVPKLFLYFYVGHFVDLPGFIFTNVIMDFINLISLIYGTDIF
jgi:hypothetical protein